jgi:DNA-binding NtrC family response regulator
MSRKARVLILDDESNTLLTLKRALELESYEVETASTIEQAREQLARIVPDVCLFDVRLPDGDGISLLASLVESNGGDSDSMPPVIMMSGHAAIEDAVRALHLGARDFLEKPIGQDRLFVTLSNALKLNRLARENKYLKEEASKNIDRDEELLGRSKPMLTLKEQIERVAQSEGRVLITGENGAGKDLVARAIHRKSRRCKGPYVSLNCAAVPQDLIESELFGHEKGAFTGALARKIGKFERADGGTLFLDEVGDMPLQMQVKLLRILQNNEIERVGGTALVKIDVRVIAATNKDLDKEIEAGRFREDLYYRLNVVPLHAPALRDRKSDIPLLIERFLVEASARNHRKTPRLSPKAMACLSSYEYPGNVRELSNLIERIVILVPQETTLVEEEHILPLMPRSRKEVTSNYRKGVKLSELVHDAERSIIAAALEENKDVVAETARALGVERSNFHKKLKALGLRS